MAGTQVDDELWQEFHRVVNMSSRELGEWLRTRSAARDTEALPDQAGTETGQRVHAERRADLEPTAGQATWRHKLMSLGHDPLKSS